MIDVCISIDDEAGDAYFVRWCSNHSGLKRVNDYLHLLSGKSDRKTLDQIRNIVLESEEIGDDDSDAKEPSSKEISVYRAATRESDAIGHAMAVVAVAIGAEDFRATTERGERRALKSKHKTGIRKRSGATIKLRVSPTDAVADARYSPETCTTIYPAATFHYDIYFGSEHSCNTDELAEFVANELVVNADAICQVYAAAQGSQTESPFLDQARIVLDYCNASPYSLRHAPNEHWKQTEWPPEKQVARLKRLADAIGYELS